MRKRSRPRGSLSKLANLYPRPQEAPKKDVVKVEAVPIGKVSEVSMSGPFDPISTEFPAENNGLIVNEDGPESLFAVLMGEKENLPDAMMYSVETEGEDGFQDKRGFGYQETDQGWKMEFRWSAHGSGAMPYAFKLLGAMKGVFNQIANLMVDSRINQQTVTNCHGSQPPRIGYKS